MESIGGVLTSLVTHLLDGDDARFGVIQGRWSEIVGAELATRCRPLLLSSGELVVEVDPGPWRQALVDLPELMLARLGELDPPLGILRVAFH